MNNRNKLKVKIKTLMERIIRYSNKREIIVITRKTLREVIEEITDFGISIKYDNNLLFTNQKIIILGDYNLEQTRELEDKVLNNHMNYGLYELYLYANTYKHQNKISSPDKIFSNTPIRTDGIEIITINHKLIIAETFELSTSAIPGYKINLIKDNKIRSKITKRIEKLVTKNKVILQNLNIEERCNFPHHILLNATRIIRIGNKKTKRGNPIIQHTRQQREATETYTLKLIRNYALTNKKTFEKIILSKFDVHLHKQQAGFKTGHSSLNPALALDTLLRHSNGNMINVTLYIKKAYDSVDRNKLYWKLIKLQKFSIRDTKLIAHLIENNKYTLCSNKATSLVKTASIGPPKGSIISPKLFNIFIDDIIHFIQKRFRHMVFLYADDILIWPTNGMERHSTINNYRFNPDKCYYNTTKDISIKVYNTNFTKQSPLKYLCFFFINRGAGVSKSTKIIRQKAVRAAVIMNKVMTKSIFYREENKYRMKLKGYTTFVRPYIDYFSQLLGFQKTFLDQKDRI
ncbi:reverse transcriptase [Hamiltosporidium magnivora]|uniref:Reverse transcriptase n=1 Tax=Hamiltosporidium magnivora TaxID=148818 RepID=A0A4Q9L422_9MICR|nr:reverse transcriptase [Hamiltosporidium magnivora]